MGDLTKNFSLKEFRCKDGSDVPEELLPNVQKLANNLQVLRDYLSDPKIIIISGYRSPRYNESVSRARKSQHILAKAGDLLVEGYTPLQVEKAIRHLQKEGKMVAGGIGVYNKPEREIKFLHYDIRGKNVRFGDKRIKDG